MNITIPDLGYNPITLEINGKKMVFKVGETYDVDAEVANLIADIQAAKPREDYRVYEKRVLTREGKVVSWEKPNGEQHIEVTGLSIIKITDMTTTLGDIKAIIAALEDDDDMVMFDVRALGAGGFISIVAFDNDDNPTRYSIFDIRGRIANGTYASSTLLITALAGAQYVASGEDIENLQTQIDSMKGGEVGEEFNINFVTSLSVSSPKSGLSFTVTDAYKFIKAVGRCEPEEHYLSWNGTAWEYRGSPLVLDIGITVTGTLAVGDVMIVVPSVTARPYTIVSHNPTGSNATTPASNLVNDFYIIEQTYVPQEHQFDAPESVLCITPGTTLVAGKYYIYNIADATGDYWCNNKRLYYLFELTHDIEATEITGDIQLRRTAIGSREETGDKRGVYEITVKPYRCYDDELYNSDTIVITGQIAAPSEDYIDIRTLTGFTTDQSMTSTGIIYNNLGHAVYGNNQWDVSNLIQWMNSDDLAMSPVRLHKNDVVTSLKNAKGMMWGMDPRAKAKLVTAKMYQQYGVDDAHSHGTLYSCEALAFLLSMKEMSFNIQTDEGVVTELYDAYTNSNLTNDAIAARGKADSAGTSPSHYRWTRSAYAGDSGGVRRVHPTGSYYYYGAYGTHRVAPAYIMKP